MLLLCILSRYGDIVSVMKAFYDHNTFIISVSMMKSDLDNGLGQFCYCMGWSGGAMVLGKLSVPGRPTNLDNSLARAHCECSKCG